MKIHDLRVKGYTFSGYVYIDELKPEVAALFPNSAETVNVEGDVYVSHINSKVPNVQVEYVTAFLGKTEVKLVDTDLDYDTLANDITEEAIVSDEYNEWKRNYYEGLSSTSEDQ